MLFLPEMIGAYRLLQEAREADCPKKASFLELEPNFCGQPGGFGVCTVAPASPTVMLGPLPFRTLHAMRQTGFLGVGGGEGLLH